MLYWRWQVWCAVLVLAGPFGGVLWAQSPAAQPSWNEARQSWHALKPSLIESSESLLQKLETLSLLNRELSQLSASQASSLAILSETLETTARSSEQWSISLTTYLELSREELRVQTERADRAERRVGLWRGTAVVTVVSMLITGVTFVSGR